MKKQREEQLREAITIAEEKLYENECLKEYREGVVELAVTSAINYAKQCHSSSDVDFTKWILSNTTACDPKKGDRALFKKESSEYECLTFEQLHVIFTNK